MSEPRILCVGMCVLDIIHVCAEYPQEDTDKRCLDGYWQRGGNASNNCSVLSKLGAKCEFLGMTSSAVAFQFLYEDCKQRNIELKNCPKSEMNPPFSSVILVKNQGTRTIVHANTGFPILKFEDFQKINLHHYSWIHFEGRNVEETKQMIDMIRKYNGKHKENNIKISVELEKLNKDLYILAMRADVVFVGKDIAQHMGWSSAKEAVYSSQSIIGDLKAKDISETWPSQMIICPWGSECSDALDGFSNDYFSLPAVSVENIVDSLGAGDTFVAAVIYAMNNLNKNLKESVDYGNHVAAFKIQHRGYDCVENFKL
ncbi:ketohexokinase-like [Calliphora vicina]|uniref:ketohexokinase-like n=1 Tax=Calliphora vicina TaxID=7373 RepID=UPI00325BFA55